MSRFFDTDYEDPEAAELRAEDRAQRRRMRLHWCSECHGRSGGPCDVDPDDDEDQPDTED